MAVAGDASREGHLEEEMNVLIAGATGEERLQIVADREFQETMRCEVIEGQMVMMTGDVSDEQREAMADYLRFLRQYRAQKASEAGDKAKDLPKA